MPKPMGFKDFIAVDYTETGDDQLAYNAKKRKTQDEALTRQQRMAASRRMKKLARKIQIGKKKAAKKVASMDKLKVRANKQARELLLKKMTKGKGKDQLSLARRQELEKKLDKKKAVIAKIAKKLLPKVRKKELEKKRGGAKGESS
tara:strand:+ start:984 stop:1421 length:438 start_codon:yes stop_codon:yes gene_type:complete